MEVQPTAVQANTFRFVSFHSVRFGSVDQYSADEVSRMVKQRQDEGVAYKNTALSRIKLSNSLEAAIAEGREDEADFCREQLAKVCKYSVIDNRRFFVLQVI